MQIAVSIFSIFAVSMIQQNTPDHLIGKVMHLLLEGRRLSELLAEQLELLGRPRAIGA